MSSTEPKLREYVVELAGEQRDIDDLQLFFGAPGPVQVVNAELPGNQKAVVFRAEEFEGLSDKQVWEAARRLIDQMNGILFTKDVHRSVVKIAAIRSRVQGEEWTLLPVTGELTAKLTARSHATGTVTGANSGENAEPQPPVSSREASWLALTMMGDECAGRVADALHALRGQPDWFELWRAFEVLMSEHASINDWPAADEEDWFRKSVNLHRHAKHSENGKKARKWLEEHRRAEMSPEAAAKFVADLAASWMDKRVELAQRTQRRQQRRQQRQTRRQA